MKYLKRLVILVAVTPFILGAALLNPKMGCDDPPLVVTAWSPNEGEDVLTGPITFVGSFDGPANEFAGMALWIKNPYWQIVEDAEISLPAQGFYSVPGNLSVISQWAHQWCGTKNGFTTCDDNKFNTVLVTAHDTNDVACDASLPSDWENAPKAAANVDLGKAKSIDKNVADFLGADGLDKQRARSEGYSYLTDIVDGTHPSRLESLLESYDMQTWYSLGAEHGLTESEVDELHKRAQSRVESWRDSACEGGKNASTNASTKAPRESTPAGFTLKNYPNPFRSQTTITYTLPERAPVTLAVYDMLGRKLVTLVDKVQQSGSHTITWSGSSEAGEPLSSGTYLLKAKMGETTKNRTVVVAR